MWTQAEAPRWPGWSNTDRNADVERRSPTLSLISDLPSAMRAAGCKHLSEGQRTIGKVWQSHLSFGIGLVIALHPLDRLKVEMFSVWGLSRKGQKNLVPAGPMPALSLAKEEGDDPVAVVLVPVELTA
jgi:hypothetical protein